MAKICDNKSVGILVWKDGKLLMIERKKYNFGFAIPAGHQDGDDPEAAARKELFEEVGVDAERLEEKLKISLPNPCKREGGTHHGWTVFEAIKWNGEIKPSADETNDYFWADPERVAELTERLEGFTGIKNVPLDLKSLPLLVGATNEDVSWRVNPGLEPPMYFLLKNLGLI